MYFNLLKQYNIIRFLYFDLYFYVLFYKFNNNNNNKKRNSIYFYFCILELNFMRDQFIEVYIILLFFCYCMVEDDLYDIFL